MPIRKTVDGPDGQQGATVMDIVLANEPITSLRLKDGTEIRIKYSATEVLKLDDTDEDGKPIYNFSGNMNVQIYPAGETQG